MVNPHSEFGVWSSGFGGTVRLPLAELGYFVSIAATRRAAPLAAMVLRSVVEIEYTGGGISAAMKVTKVRPGQEVCDLPGNECEGQLLAAELRG